MDLLVFVEKISAIASQWRPVISRIPGVRARFVPMHSMGAYEFAPAEDLRPAGLPRPLAPRYRLRPGWRWRVFALAEGALNGVALDTALTERAAQDGIGAVAREMDLVLDGADPDHRGAVEVWKCLTEGRPEGAWTGPPLGWVSVVPGCMASADAVAQAVVRFGAGHEGQLVRRHRGVVEPLVAFGLVKDRFDYGWMFQWRALAPPFLAAAGVPPTAEGRAGSVPSTHLVSKYGVQVMLAFVHGDIPPARDGAVLRKMVQWQGTGRYDATTSELKFGSPTSRVEIIEQLVGVGLLARDAAGWLHATPAAARLAALLPRKARDPDLPFRLAAWCAAQDTAAVDRYMGTWFKALRNARGKLAPTSEMNCLSGA